MSRTRLALVSLAALALAAAGPAQRPAAPREEAYRANNLGIGLLEQYRYDDAAEAFRRALGLEPSLALARVNLAIALFNVPDLAGARREAEAAAAAWPEAPQPHYVLGLIAKAQSRPDDAGACFGRVLERDAGDVGALVNLGQMLVQQRRYADAVGLLRRAADAEPYNATAAYNLGIALTRAGQAEEGRRMLELFQKLRDSGYGTLLGLSYPDQGRYAEAVASTGSEAALVDPKTPDVRFADATAEAFPNVTDAAAGQGRATLVDVDGDGDLDVYECGSGGQRLFQNDGGRFAEATARLGLDPKTPAIGAAAGDYDGDGRPDLLVLRKGGAVLLRNEPKAFSEIAAEPLKAEGLSAAALVDVDHDGDLDVLLVGKGIHLVRNNGNGSFADITAAAGLAGSSSPPAAVLPTDFDNRRDVDLLVADAGAGRLFKNMRDGTFKDVAGEVGLPTSGRFLCAAAADVNKDGFTDVFLGRADGPDALVLSDGRGRFGVAAAPSDLSGTTAGMFVDYDDDGLADLLAVSPAGARLLRNLGRSWVDVTQVALPRGIETAGATLAAGDLDADGDEDALLRLASGGLRLLRNEGGNRNRSFRVALTGRVSNKNGIGAKVEIRAGSLSHRIETYAATPAAAPADVVFGLGQRPGVDAVRVLWPSGILQTETEKDKTGARLASLEELDRKPSSCPYLYAWNGRRFEFVTDFMGGGEMGYWLGPGLWNAPDPEEFVRIRGDQLEARDGRYELRVTNELEEALFVDRLRLVAVDHPADVAVFPDEGMLDPPKAFRLHAVRHPRPVASATDDQGRDVADRLARLDRVFVEGFALHRIRGYAAEHTLTLDVGAADVLLLTGWTDYAFSSDNVAAHQAGLAMHVPSLQMEDDAGRWQTVIEDIGIPVGRPQTVPVEVAGKWPGKSRRVRIATNMRIYWDQALVGERAEAETRLVALDPVLADLRERGFSAEVSPDGREPWSYDYARVTKASPWKVFPGRYTRTGDVRELLAGVEDLFVVSKPGDEIALAFDARSLPPLVEGRTRTFLLQADGFSKEMDIHSATPDVIGPLPFHGMSRYPYTAPEAYPMTPERRAALERTLTRVVTAPVAPLEVALAGEK